MFKSMLLASILFVSFNTLVSAADVECTKDKRGFYRPSNQIAVEIAASLKLKSCDRSDRFTDAVKEMGLTHNLPAAKTKAASLDELKKKYGKKS